MTKQLIAINLKNNTSMHWQLDAAGNRVALLIEQGSHRYRFTISQHARAYLYNIGFKSAAGFPADIETTADATLRPLHGQRTHATVARWVDAHIVNLLGSTEFIKSLGIDIYSQILNDPTRALPINKSPQTFFDKGKRVKLHTRYNTSQGCWLISDLKINGTKYHFGRYRTRKHAREVAIAALKAYNTSPRRFQRWYDKHCTDKHLSHLHVGDTAIHLSEKIHGAAALKAFDASIATNLEQAAQQLRRLRNGRYIGVESRIHSSGETRYRANININGLKWLSAFVDTAEKAARLHDTTYRQLFAISKRVQPHLLNKLNFFDAGMRAIAPLQGKARRDLLEGSEPYNKVLHKNEHGHIRFDATSRQFTAKVRHHKTKKLISLGYYATELNAVAAFDQAITQMHKCKAIALRFGHYAEDVILEWQSQDFSTKGLARIKPNHKHTGVHEVYAKDKVIGYRGAVTLPSGKKFQTRIFRFSEKTSQEKAQTEAELAFDTLYASLAKARHLDINYSSVDASERDTIHIHDERWWHEIKAHRKVEYSSPYHGVSRAHHDRYTSNSRWFYKMIYHTPDGKAHTEYAGNIVSETQAYTQYDRMLRRLLNKKSITLDYYLQRINDPKAEDIVLAKFLGLEQVGHGAHSIKLNTIDDTLFDTAYDEGEVTAVIHYKNRIGRDYYIGIYARMATPIFDDIDDAHDSAIKLMDDHSIRLRASELDKTHLTELLGNTHVFKPSNYKLTHSLLNVQLMCEFGLRGQDNPGQGNCLFHAFARQLELIGIRKTDGSRYTHEDCRQIAVDAMIMHIGHYREFIIGQADEFVWHMAQNGVWADHLPLQALARHFNLDVLITHSAADPRTGLRQTTVMRQNEEIDPRRTVMLGYIDQVHYVSAELMPADHPRANSITPAQRLERIHAHIAAQAIDNFNPETMAEVEAEAPALPLVADTAPQPPSAITTSPPVIAEPEPAPVKRTAPDDSIAEPSCELETKPPRLDDRAPSRTIKRARTSSPQPSAVMPSLFSISRGSAYVEEFADRVADNSSIEAVCNRLSGLVHYCLASPAFNGRFHPALNTDQIKIKVARAINDVAAMIEFNQAKLGLSTRTTRLLATLLRKFAMVNHWDGDRAHNHTRISEHDAYLAIYRLSHDCTRVPRTVDEIFRGMFKEFLQGSEALYGDNSSFEASKLANLCYHAIIARYTDNPEAIAACEAEFKASFGDDAIHWHGTREEPFAAPDLDMTRP